MSSNKRREVMHGLATLDLAVQSQELEIEARRRITRVLPLFDQVERLCRGADRLPPEELVARAEGLAILADLADAIATACDLARIGKPGERVNGELHEVVDVRSDLDHPQGTVVEVVEPGWMYEERPLRLARVIAAGRADGTEDRGE